MKPELVLYARRDCCLCDAMKAVIRRVAETVPLTLREVDVDSFAELRRRFGEEVPVLFIDGRKAFKIRLTARELEKRLVAKGRLAKLAAKLRAQRR